MSNTFRIYPPIGIARLGNSAQEFFIASESVDSLGTEISASGVELPVASFKDGNHAVKRQAARFQILEFNAEHPEGQPFSLPEGANLFWRVRLANIKDAVKRLPGPPSKPIIPALDPARLDRSIDSGWSVVQSGGGRVELGGRYLKTDVYLGEAWTDDHNRLLVLGGRGKSGSPEGAPIGNEPEGGGFYNNRGWFDDVADGPIAAEIVLKDGSRIAVEPAWLIVAPPDFAPGVRGVTTLYDVIVDVAAGKGWLSLSSVPNFGAHIRPLIERTRALRWVNDTHDWSSISADWETLADDSDAAAALRDQVSKEILALESAFRKYVLPEWQRKYLKLWASGRFDRESPAQLSLAEQLTKAPLDGTIGQGFFPGIEAGRLVTEPSIYSTPFDFRFDHSFIQPGWLTAMMALPWQADFLECHTVWWPTQRPDLAPQADGSFATWIRPLDDEEDHRTIATDQFVMRFGVVTPRPTSAEPDLQIEEGWAVTDN